MAKRKIRSFRGLGDAPEMHYQRANMAAGNVIKAAAGVKKAAACGKKLHFLLLAYRDAGVLDTEEQSGNMDSPQGDKARRELENASNNFEDRCVLTSR